VMVVDHSVGLSLGQTGEGEHTNLGGDMVPGSWSSKSFDFSSESGSHGKNSSGDSLQFSEERLQKSWGSVDGVNNEGTVLWWVK